MSVNCFLGHFIPHFHPFGCEQNGTIQTKQSDHTACRSASQFCLVNNTLIGRKLTKFDLCLVVPLKIKGIYRVLRQNEGLSA